MNVSVVSPWSDRRATWRHAWRLSYQWVLAMPWLGQAIVRDGRLPRRVLRAAAGAAVAAVYVDVLRDPARARASNRLYRDFQLRELPALARGRYDGTVLQVPVKVLFPRSDGAQHASQLRGLDAHCAAGLDVEVVPGTHLLLDELPGLVADRAAAWFA